MHLHASLPYTAGMFIATLSIVRDSEELSAQLEKRGFDKTKQEKLYALMLELAQTFYYRGST